MNRRQEVHQLLRMTPEQIKEKAGERLRVMPDIDKLHETFAQEIFEEIQENNLAGERTKLILPVGPVGQYPILADMINKERLSLENCWFFYMDENCDDDGKVLPTEHPLSFKGVIASDFMGRVDEELRIPEGQLIVPDQDNVDRLEDMINDVGGIDTCYGGIGLHGHVAFNEPEPGVKDTGPRRIELNLYSVTINCIRAHCGGNLESFPREAYTLGMRQILGARRLRLFCRNGIELDWANTVLRLALFGEPGDDYPVTHIRDHGDYLITTDNDTLAQPKYIVE